MSSEPPPTSASGRYTILEALGAASELSAGEAAEAVGVSRVSARRYLEHFVSTGQVEVRLKYGGAGRPERRGSAFERLRVFLRQVIAELRKVVYPTRQQVLTYTAVVLVFVVVIMTYVSLLDYGFGRLVFWAFGG